MDADFPEIVPMTLEGPGVVALLPLHHLVLEMLVRGQLALHFDAAAALQSHLGEGYQLGTYHQCGLCMRLTQCESGSGAKNIFVEKLKHLLRK